MTRSSWYGSRRPRGVLSAAVGMVVAAGLFAGPAAMVQAEPSPSPAPAPTEAAAPTEATTSEPSASGSPSVASGSGASGSGASGSGASGSGASGSGSYGAGSSAAVAAGATQQAQGDVLDQLAEEYAVGAGGGQLSNLLKVSLKLRAMGFKPSKKYLDGITAAMKYRPNQNPLISALKDTIAYQQKIQAQTQILQQAQSRQNAGSAVMGAGQMPGDSNPGYGQPGAPSPVAPAPLPPTP